MTVQKLIDELTKLTEKEKTLPITMNVCVDYGSEENVEIDDFCVTHEYGWVDNHTKGMREVILVLQ